jgi:hypothetical protein
VLALGEEMRAQCRSAMEAINAELEGVLGSGPR